VSVFVNGEQMYLLSDDGYIYIKNSDNKIFHVNLQV